MDGILTVKVARKNGEKLFYPATKVRYTAQSCEEIMRVFKAAYEGDLSALEIPKHYSRDDVFRLSVSMPELYVTTPNGESELFMDGIAYVMNSTGKTVDVIDIDDAVKCREDLIIQMREDRAKARDALCGEASVAA